MGSHTRPMPSSHPIATTKSPWRWLTKKEEKKKPKANHAPTRHGSDQKAAVEPETPTKRSSYAQRDPHLAKPEPALHRLQELKSPPPIAPPTSTATGPDRPGFKSRPLYRRTRSSPADPAEDEKTGMRGASGSGYLAPASAVRVSKRDASGAGHIGNKHGSGGCRVGSAGGSCDEGCRVDDRDGGVGDSGRGGGDSGGGCS